MGHVDYGPSGPVVTSDGYTNTDLKAVSLEAMQEYTGLKHDRFIDLFNATVEAVNGDPLPVKGIETPQFSQNQLLESWQSTINKIRIQAEEKALLTEFVKMLRAEIKVKK